jgi:polyphosphate kinase
VAPVEDPLLRDDLMDTLERAFADDMSAWILHADGSWERLRPRGPEPRNLQHELMLGHTARAAEPRDG